MAALCHVTVAAWPVRRAVIVPRQRPDELTQGIDGAGSAADVAQAVADGLGGDLSGSSGRFERCVAKGEGGGGGARVRAARAVGGAVRVAVALEQVDRRAVEEDVR